MQGILGDLGSTYWENDNDGGMGDYYIPATYVTNIWVGDSSTLNNMGSRDASTLYITF